MKLSTAKTIQIFLPTGEPRGIRIAEITTRIVQAVLILRSDLAQGKQRTELSLPGIYFLFGGEVENAKPIVYIGQSEDGRNRLHDHNNKKAFWQTAIYCTSKTQNFTQAHIRYMEWYCMQKTKEIGRYHLENSQVPDKSNFVTEAMEAELLDVFETINALLSTLGYPVFEPITIKADPATWFYCTSRGCEATGELVEDGFVVYQGSKSRIDLTPSASPYITTHRERLLAAGVIEERDGVYFYLQDYLFTSPSAASDIVTGASSNGWVAWKDKAGRTLSEVYRESN